MSSGSDKRQREHILRVRLSDDELATLTERAGSHSVAGYVRAASLGQSPRSSDTQAAIAALSRIGNNLNQIAKRAHQTGHVESAAILSPMLDELRAVIEALS